MASRRPRLVALGALSTAVLLAGCPAGGLLIPKGAMSGGTISSGLQNKQKSGAALRGVVSMPTEQLTADGRKPAAYALTSITDTKGVVGAEVSVRDYRMKRAPNSTSTETDGNGKFTLRGVPSEQIWVAVAEYGGVVGANLVKPKSKKTVLVDITLASTLAAAALVPYFVPPEEGEDSEYVLNDLDLDLFQDLVEAVDAALAADTPYHAAKTLKALQPGFDQIKTADADVRQAYDALVGALEKQAEERLGKKPAPVDTSDTTQDGTDADGDDTASDATDPDETATEESKPNYSPISGTIATVSAAKVNSTDPLQMTVMSLKTPLDSQQAKPALLIPDGNRVVAMVNDSLALPLDLKLGDTAISGLRAVTEGAGSKAYAVAKVGSEFKLLAIDLATINPLDPKPTITAKAMQLPTGVTIGSIASLVYSADREAFFAADDKENVLYEISDDTATAEVSVYSGKYGNSGSTLDAGAKAADVRLAKPSSLTLNGTTMYAVDTDNHRILSFNLVDDSATKLSGSSFGLQNGTLALAKLQYPVSGFFADGRLYVAELGNSALRVLEPEANTVRSFGTTEHPTGSQLINLPRGIAYFNNAVYTVDNDGKVWKFTPKAGD